MLTIPQVLSNADERKLYDSMTHGKYLQYKNDLSVPAEVEDVVNFSEYHEDEWTDIEPEADGTFCMPIGAEVRWVMSTNMWKKRLSNEELRKRVEARRKK